MPEASDLRKAFDEYKKHWRIGDIFDYALALSDRKAYGGPAIVGKMDIFMYFFDLVFNRELEGVPESLLEVFSESLKWDCRGPIPLSDEIHDHLIISGLHYSITSAGEAAYGMSPDTAAYFLSQEKYLILDEAGKAFLQKVANDLSCGSTFWETFSPDLTPPYQRKRS